MNAIVTVIGKDKVGIIATVCIKLAELNVNVLDISQTILNNKFTMVMAVDAGAANVSFDITQTIVKGFFNMMMVVDVENITKSFGEVAQELEQVGEEIGVSVKIQREEIFDAMHRI